MKMIFVLFMFAVPCFPQTATTYLINKGELLKYTSVSSVSNLGNKTIKEAGGQPSLKTEIVQLYATGYMLLTVTAKDEAERAFYDNLASKLAIIKISETTVYKWLNVARNKWETDCTVTHYNEIPKEYFRPFSDK